jgi:hypothetical protein
VSWLVPEASYVRDPYRRSKPNSYLVEMLLAIKSLTRHDTRNESTAKTSAHISMFESRAATPGPEVPSECPEPTVLATPGPEVPSECPEPAAAAPGPEVPSERFGSPSSSSLSISLRRSVVSECELSLSLLTAWGYITLKPNHYRAYAPGPEVPSAPFRIIAGGIKHQDLKSHRHRSAS